MGIPGRIQRNNILNAVNIALLTGLFALAYSQSPLYTSNQNQYFLHGLAQAGFGYLEEDWLANTLDPTPVFSWIVSLTYKVTGVEELYYIYYALIMGLYLFCTLGIADTLKNIYKSRTATLFLSGLIFVLHSAAIRFTLSRTLGVNWTYVLEDGVADQRMLGPVFQPSTFGVFLLLSVYLFLRRKPYLAVLAAVLAATVHPTYLLSAAMLTATYLLITYKETSNLSQCARIGFVGLLAISPLLLYVYSAFAGSSSDTTAQARDILVNFRIPHHTNIRQWFDTTALVKILLITIALNLVRKSRLFLILLVPLLSAGLLTLLQLWTGNNFLALLFPWRISTLLVPLSTTILLTYSVTKLLTLPRMQSNNAHKLIHLVSIVMIFVSVLIGGIRMKIDFERKNTSAERKVQEYVSTQKKPGDLYLVPVKMQDFRLFSGAPAFIGFKSIPYKDLDVLEWHKRVKLADQFYLNEDCETLDRLVKEYQITHVLIPSDWTSTSCASFERIYDDEYYHLYRIK